MTSAIVPAIPTIQDDLHASENGVTFVLTGYLLAASVATAILGRLGDMLGKQRGLIWTLVVFTAGTLLGAVSHSLDRADRRPGDPGSGRRHLPALVRDHPRRVPAGTCAGQHRVHLRDPRHGRGRRNRARRHRRRAPRLGVGLLADAADRTRCDRRSLATHPGIARRVARPDQLARRRAHERGHLSGAHRDQPGDRVGLGLGASARAARRRLRALRGLGRRRVAERGAVDRHGDDARPRRVDGESRRVPARRGVVLELPDHPAVRLVPPRRVRRPVGPLPAPLDDRRGRSELVRRADRATVRLEERDGRRLCDHRSRIRRSSPSARGSGSCSSPRR